MTSRDKFSDAATSHLTHWRRLILMVGLALSAGTGLAWFLEAKGLNSYPATIAARSTTITAPRGGRIDNVIARTGQSVDPGHPLLQLTDAQLEEKLAAKQRQITQCEAELEQAKAAAEIELAWRRRTLRAEIFDTQLKLANLAQEKLNKQVEQLAWKDFLTSSDSPLNPVPAAANHSFQSIALELQTPDERRLSAMLREEAAASSTEALQAQITLCDERLKMLQSMDTELEAKVRASSGIALAETRLAAAREELSAIQKQSSDLAITSPTYGTIGEIRHQTGDPVNQGETLVEILDDHQPHLIAYFPSSAAPALHEGTKVTILFPAEETRLGVISALPVQTKQLPGIPESILAVKIDPAGKLWPRLAIGSNVKVQLQ